MIVKSSTNVPSAILTQHNSPASNQGQIDISPRADLKAQLPI